MRKKDDIIQTWINFSQNEDKNIQEYINWGSYYFDTSKEYIRNILAEYNSSVEQEKREQEEKQKIEFENMLKEIEKEL